MATLINLHHQKLEAVPEDLVQQTNSPDQVTSISLNQNYIKHLSPVLGQFKNLSVLYLGANCISEVPDFTPCPNLTTLYLNNNKIEQITNLNTLKRLVRLDLRQNFLTSCEGLPTDAPELTWLSLSCNSVISLKPLPKYPKLQFLGMFGNACTEMQHTYLAASSPQLQSVDFRFNPITRSHGAAHASALVKALPQLTMLDDKTLTSNQDHSTINDGSAQANAVRERSPATVERQSKKPRIDS